jgi:hypothetical protein
MLRTVLGLLMTVSAWATSEKDEKTSYESKGVLRVITQALQLNPTEGRRACADFGPASPNLWLVMKGLRAMALTTMVALTVATIVSTSQQCEETAANAPNSVVACV